MRNLLPLLILGMLPVVVAGCGGSSSEVGSSNPPPAPPVAAALPQAGNAAAVPQASSAGKSSTGLIQSTNPDVRVQEVSKGQRNDPFAGLPFSPEITLPAPTPSPGTGRTASPSNPASGNGVGKSPSSPASTANLPQSSGVVSSPPSVELAKAVEVTGIVQLGGNVQAIVKAPNEPSSRNVQAGERLSNGQVLVKRIVAGEGNPVVVLEQNGVEVIKTLDEDSVAG